MKLALTVLVGAAGALVACTSSIPPPPGSPPPVAASDAAPACFRTPDIVSHRVADDHTVYLRLRDRTVFRLTMSGGCLAGAGPTDPLVIRGSSGVLMACRPIDLDISLGHDVGGLIGGGRTPCIVQSMARLTPDEVAALPDRLRP